MHRLSRIKLITDIYNKISSLINQLQEFFTESKQNDFLHKSTTPLKHFFEKKENN